MFARRILASKKAEVAEAGFITRSFIICTLREMEMRNAFEILIGKPEGKRPYERRPSVDGKVILEWILGK
jgi:hypothetical protein